MLPVSIAYRVIDVPHQRLRHNFAGLHKRVALVDMVTRLCIGIMFAHVQPPSELEVLTTRQRVSASGERVFGTNRV